jgi:indole-3-glycerol phosphate synthase
MSGFVETGTYLDRILAQTAIDLETRKQSGSEAELERLASHRPAPLSFKQALNQPNIAVISEIKRASPSKGRFAAEVDPPKLAAEYVHGGAAAISVLTDEPFFQGSLADMAAAANVAHAASKPIPVLRKDFVIDRYQLKEAVAYGADAALLIVSALEQSQLVNLLGDARALGLSVLVEVHDEAEMARAIDAGADVIGINNRDLRSFHVDLAVTERVGVLCPPDAILVAESGIFNRNDVQRLANAGASAILVGESLILAPDRVEALHDLGNVTNPRWVEA